MCGIIGGFAFTQAGMELIDRTPEAIAAIRHRGPDGEGVHRSGAVALGHTRLSIIDPRSAANQPMFDPTGRYSIAFNGEIFNYQELRDTHLPQIALRTTSDTEVLLHLFIQKGPEAFSLLRGFFALAIYDEQQREMYVARDRYGKKPVHLYQSEDALLFSSEMRGLLALGIKRELNWSVVPYYLQFNYLPQPLGFLTNTAKLRPGHYLRIADGLVEEHRFYTLQIQPAKYAQYTYEQAQKKLVELLDEATRLRLVSDVPLGAFLSGGIDSSVVVALASRHLPQLKTFSIGFRDNPYFDETRYANLVAKQFNTDHTVFSLTNDDLLHNIDDVLDAIDEPFADSSVIPTYILCKKTREYVTVALSGDGGDEVFAGYNKHKAEYRAMAPGTAGRLVAGMRPLWKLLPKSRNSAVTNKVRQLSRFAEASALSAGERYWQWASILPENQVASYLQKPLLPAAFKEAQIAGMDGSDLNQVLLADMNLVLPGDMLVKVDLMSMANSLEVRSPFLDHEVVDFAFGLPAHYKINGDLKKRIVQDAFRSMLPPELYNRPKQGFEIPLLGWFRKELWSKINDDLLGDRFIEEQGFFDLAKVQQLKKKLQSSNPEDSHATVWALMVFQHWWRKHLA